MTIFERVFEHLALMLQEDVTTQLLLMAIALDVLTGITRATKEHKLNSTTGINGLLRHGLVVIIVAIVSYFSIQFNEAWFSYAFTVGFCYQYLVSILENWSLSGYQIPAFVSVLLDKLPNNELMGKEPGKKGEEGQGKEDAPHDNEDAPHDNEGTPHDKNNTDKISNIIDQFKNQK